MPGNKEEQYAPTESTTESPTESTTESPTESTTEPPTESHTESPTESPTESQTEPPTSLTTALTLPIMPTNWQFHRLQSQRQDEKLNKTEPSINNLFLLGAGFTKSVFSNAPLNSELLQKVIDSCKLPPNRNRIELNVNGERILKTTLPKECSEKYETSDIEVLLTRLDLEISAYQDNALRNDRKEIERLLNERKDIERLLVEYFRQFRLGYNNNLQVLEKNTWLESFAKKLLRENDAIVNLNYDCSLEGLLDHYEVWSPNGGYVEIANFSQNECPENPKDVHIAKIHGSENFRLCSVLQDKDRKYVSFEINGAIYPRSGKNQAFTEGIDPEAYIIAPSFVKIPHEDIERMMIEVLDVVDKAKNFIIIGCSMRPEDAFLWLLLTKFLCRPDKNGRIIIVDPHADSTKEKINSHYWGGNEVTNVVEIKGELQKEDIFDELLKVVSK